ncbi:MAG TPA: hypothetical protein VFG56_01340 [Candidatus Saccharimonadales bacterium]|nr:hypothetical protein [Candidatus Saccharimonadales bacterium]
MSEFDRSESMADKANLANELAEASAERHKYVLDKIETAPPIDPDSVDLTVKNPDRLRAGLKSELEYSFAVESEVMRNVKELHHLFPEMPDTDRLFVDELWRPHEQMHGLAIGRLLDEIGLEEPPMDLETISPKMRVLAALGRSAAIADVERLIYYLTGASTEKAATMLYDSMTKTLKGLGETAIENTLIGQIKRQEPIHLAYYRKAAEELTGQLSPWQLHLTRVLRSKSFNLVGVTNRQRQQTMGQIISDNIGYGDEQLEPYAEKIGIVDHQLLWAERQGMKVPPYILKALKDSVEVHKEATENSSLA